MRRLVVACVLAVFSTPLIAAEPSLSVRVRDPQDAPVPGAATMLASRDGRARLSARTDEAGLCRFAVAAGEYLVEATAPGFARSRAAAVTVRPGAAAEIDVHLPAAAFHEHMVVTAAGTLQTGDETSKAVGVVDGAALEAHGEVWLPDALRSVPGLFVQQLGGPGSFTSIKSRGLRNEDTALLIDGVPFRDAAAPQGDAAGFVGDMPLANVDRLEVLRGSGSSLHGSHASGGALNVITRPGGGALNGSLLAEAGGLGLTRARARVGGGLGRDRLAYSLGATHLDVTKGMDGDDAARQSGAQGRIDLRLGASASLAASFFGIDSRGMTNESPGAFGTLPASGIVDARAGVSFTPAANDPDNTRESDFLSARVAFDHRLGSGLGYTIAYQHVSTQRAYVDGPLGVTAFEPQGRTLSEYDGRVHTLVARADGQWSPRHLTTAGVELQSETFVNRSVPVSPAPPSTVDVTQRSYTLLLQHQVRASSRLHVSGAVRAQGFALRTPAFSPADKAPYQGLTFDAPPAAYTADGSIAYLVGSGTKLRMHVGNGYRAPSLYERFGTFFGSFGYSVYGDPRLGPERSLAWDAGVDQELAGGRLRASFTYFHARLRRVIVFETFDAAARAAEPFGRARGYRNAEGKPARGVEAALSASPVRNLQLGASYTHTDARPRAGQPVDLPQAYGVPRRMFAAHARHTLGRWQWAVDVTAASEHLAPLFDSVTFASRAFRFDGRVDADAVLSYSLPLGARRSVRVFGKVDNIAGGTSYEQGFAVPGRLAYGGVSFEL